MEGSAERHAPIGGADVEHVARVTGSRVAGVIDVVNDAVKRSGLAPTHVSPISGIVVHGGEVARSATSRAIEGGARVSISPRVTAVGGPEHEVVAGGEATAILAHAGDIHVARSRIAGYLDIADEWGAAGQLSRIGPADPVVSGIADEEGSAANIEIVP